MIFAKPTREIPGAWEPDNKIYLMDDQGQYLVDEDEAYLTCEE